MGYLLLPVMVVTCCFLPVQVGLKVEVQEKQINQLEIIRLYEDVNLCGTLQPLWLAQVKIKWKCLLHKRREIVLNKWSIIASATATVYMYWFIYCKLYVIKKPQEWGGPGLLWAAAPEDRKTRRHICITCSVVNQLSSVYYRSAKQIV